MQQKKAKQASQRPNNWSKTRKHRKIHACKVPPAKTKLTRGSEQQTKNIMADPAGAPKIQDGLQKKHGREQLTTMKATAQQVIVPMRVRSNSVKKQ